MPPFLWAFDYYFIWLRQYNLGPIFETTFGPYIWFLFFWALNLHFYLDSSKNLSYTPSVPYISVMRETIQVLKKKR